MLPDFALHHLPLYSVTLGCAAGLGLWLWVRWTLARQTRDERREAIAHRALASSTGQQMVNIDELATDTGPHTVRLRVR